MTEKPRTEPIVMEGGQAVIHPPRRVGTEGDWYCAVQCPFLFKGTRRVYGETPERADEIALSFVRARLGLSNDGTEGAP